jgi:hypothetical protein
MLLEAFVDGLLLLQSCSFLEKEFVFRISKSFRLTVGWTLIGQWKCRIGVSMT